LAIEKRQTLGEVTGTLGNLVRRKRYGKTVVYLRPGKYHKSKSLEAKAGRNSFALSVAFAKKVNSIPELKQVWQLAKLEGVVAYNRVIKYNKNFIEENSLTLNNIITPTGIYLLIKEFFLSQNQISLLLDLNQVELKKLLQFPFQLHYVLFTSNPNNSADKPYEILIISRSIDQSSTDNTYLIDFIMDTFTQHILSRYNKVICYVAASKFSGKKKEIFWTSTVAKEFNL
jgi:hypothetical protein